MNNVSSQHAIKVDGVPVAPSHTATLSHSRKLHIGDRAFLFELNEALLADYEDDSCVVMTRKHPRESATKKKEGRSTLGTLQLGNNVNAKTSGDAASPRASMVLILCM